MKLLQPQDTVTLPTNHLLRGLCAVVCGVLLTVTAGSAAESSQVADLLDQAETLLWLGVVDQGAGRSFEEAQDLVEEAAARLAEADPSAAGTRRLSLEVEALQEDLRIFTELYEERFYGVFPLARLITTSLLMDEGFAFTEQLYHPPEVAAVEIASRRAPDQLKDLHHPHVVITSRPTDRRLENVALEVLLRDGRSTPLPRRALVAALSAEDLDALDRGEVNAQLVDRILGILDAANLVLLSVEQPVELDNVSVRRVRGDYYTRGEVVQGSPASASLNILMESFEYFGFARDRRAMYWPINGAQLLLFVLAVAWAALVPWRLHKPLKVFYRFAIGAALFVFGRAFTVLAVTLLRKIIPDSAAIVASVWWWPALLGLLAILGGGLVAWIVQARLTDVVPGARGARAVGAIFGLVALGACSYFVAPLLLLDEIRGFANLVPFVLASVSLALLFGYAARTGPPVPHYFMLGPLLLASLAGICLLIASPKLLWALVGLTGFLCLAAWGRHRFAVSHGTEELEPSPEEAAQADQEKLVKLAKKLTKKL